jgi:peroxiredoxin
MIPGKEPTAMKHVWTSLLVAGLVSVSLVAAIKPGQKAPAFTAPASLAGKELTFSLEDALKKGPVVVYFYPSAFTGGCNVQAHTFSVNKEKFDAAGASIVGVSADSIARLNAFSSDPQYCAGKFPVASDPDGAIAKKFELAVSAAREGAKDSRGEAIDHGFIERVTFVIKPDHTIAATFSSNDDKISPADHVEKALAAVAALK